MFTNIARVPRRFKGVRGEGLIWSLSVLKPNRRLCSSETYLQITVKAGVQEVFFPCFEPNIHWRDVFVVITCRQILCVLAIRYGHSTPVGFNVQH